MSTAAENAEAAAAHVEDTGHRVQEWMEDPDESGVGIMACLDCVWTDSSFTPIYPPCG